METAIGRRPRTRRISRGKRLEITARDLEVFRRLGQYRYLRTPYLYAFAAGASETRFKERLGDLFHEGYLDRPAQQWELADARCTPAVYELANRGRTELAWHDLADTGCRTFLSAAPPKQFRHSLAICEVLASIELGSCGRPGLRFIPWSEILARAPEATKMSSMPFRIATRETAIVPDGLFGLEYTCDARKAYRFFALEVDRGTMPVARRDSRQTSLLEKLRTYREIIERRLYKDHWGISTLLVLTLTVGDGRLANVLAALKEIESASALLFKTIGGEPRALANPVLALVGQPWVRAVAAGLDISKSC